MQEREPTFRTDYGVDGPYPTCFERIGNAIEVAIRFGRWLVFVAAFSIAIGVIGASVALVLGYL